MTQYIGVKGWGLGDITTELKRAALLCDKIAINHVHFQGDCKKYPHTRRTIEVLKERGVVINGPDAVHDDERHPWLRSYPRNIITNPVGAVKEFILAGITDHKIPDLYGATLEFEREHLMTAADVYARVASLQLQGQDPETVAIPLLARGISAQVLVPTRKEIALSVVFDQIPMPHRGTPWEDIFSWREDDVARDQFALLREWVNRAARSDSTREEMKDELEARVAEYSSHMKRQHKKFTGGRFEMICMALLQSLEELPKVKISPLLDVVFKIRREELDLIKEESEFDPNAPGREVAYIVATRRRFSPDQRSRTHNPADRADD